MKLVVFFVYRVRIHFAIPKGLSVVSGWSPSATPGFIRAHRESITASAHVRLPSSLCRPESARIRDSSCCCRRSRFWIQLARVEYLTPTYAANCTPLIPLRSYSFSSSSRLARGNRTRPIASRLKICAPSSGVYVIEGPWAAMEQWMQFKDDLLHAARSLKLGRVTASLFIANYNPFGAKTCNARPSRIWAPEQDDFHPALFAGRAVPTAHQPAIRFTRGPLQRSCISISTYRYRSTCSKMSRSRSSFYLRCFSKKARRADLDRTTAPSCPSCR